MSAEVAVEDESLIARSREGDLSAFDELITRHRNRVYMVTYSIIRNSEDALDLTQETFIRAWKSLGKLDGNTQFGAWLSRIARNASIDLLRKKQARPQAEFDVGPMSIDAASKTTPAEPERPGLGVERGEIRERFEQALTTLSADHREVIVLKEVEDLSYKEIAEVIGCSIGTVMSRLFYARKKMQSELKDLYDEL
ncbi:MAG: sigma-70 family RNA polymerase sigma factor [Chthoniobacterales bacterium]